MHDSIKKYKDEWGNNPTRSPFVLMIGGYAGTGKTTLAEKVQHIFSHSIIVNTGVVRAVLQGELDALAHSYMHRHTFDLYEDGTTDKEIIEVFEKQCRRVCQSVYHVLRFAQSERQILIIDGNHLLPGFVVPDAHWLTANVVLHVPSERTHMKMLGGPTHDRHLSSDQFRVARLLHDHTVHLALQHNIFLLEFDENLDVCMSYIDHVLEKFYLS